MSEAAASVQKNNMALLFTSVFFANVHNLTYPDSMHLNGMIGIVRGVTSETGPCEVEIIARPEGNSLLPERRAPPVSLMPSNLGHMPEVSVGFLLQVLAKYLDFKSTTIMETDGPGKRMYENMAELFAVPGYSLTWAKRASMAQLLSIIGRFDEATRMLQGCIADITPDGPRYLTMHYSLASALTQRDRPGDALAAALKIDPELGSAKMACLSRSGRGRL